MLMIADEQTELDFFFHLQLTVILHFFAKSCMLLVAGRPVQGNLPAEMSHISLMVPICIGLYWFDSLLEKTS